MNMGFREAEILGSLIHKILREGAPVESLETYDRDQQQEWRILHGLNGGLKPAHAAKPWVAAQSSRILSCLPGCSVGLIPLVEQIGLSLT